MLLLILPILSQQAYRDEALHRFVPFSTSSCCALPELPLIAPTTRWRAALIQSARLYDCDHGPGLGDSIDVENTGLARDKWWVLCCVVGGKPVEALGELGGL